MFNSIFKKKEPFIGWVQFKDPNTEPYGDLGVYLVNPSKIIYENVQLFTGAFEGDVDGILETSKVVKNLGTLRSDSFLKIDAMSWYDLDFVFWYHLDFYRELKSRPQCYWFEIMKAYAWDEKKIITLPVLNAEGIRLSLDPRDGAPITDEVKTVYMESRYTKSA